MGHDATPAKVLIAVALVLAVAPHVAATAEPWPPLQEGLVFGWATAFEAAHARDDQGNPQLGRQFTPAGRGRLNHHGALVLDCGGFVAKGIAPWMGQQISDRGACTVVLWIAPRVASQEGTILRLGGEAGLAIAQAGSNLRVTCGRGDTRAVVESALPPTEGPVALAVSISDEGMEVYLNGQPEGDAAPGLRLAGLALPELRLGQTDAAAALPGWAGVVEGIAIYARRLAQEEVAALSKAYGAHVDGRKGVVAQLQVRARLTGKSTVLSPADLAPYSQGLCVYRYTVLDVRSGEYDEPTLHVAHWTVLDNRRLPYGGVELGTEHDLTLELLDDNPQLASENLSDDIVEDFSLPYFFDAGGLSTACAAPKD